MQSKLLTPEEIATLTPEEAPYLVFPSLALLFADRETRLRELAAGHSLRDYLLFLADLARAQDTVVKSQASAPISIPSLETFRDAANNALAPLSLNQWQRPAEWISLLNALTKHLGEQLPPGPALDAVLRLQSLSSSELDVQADRLVSGIMLGLDFSTAPIIAAALQVFFARVVVESHSKYGGKAFGRIIGSNRCPCCGSLPSVSMVRIGANDSGARYLHCSLCQIQWHLVRIKCASCENTRTIHYQSLAGLHGEDDRLSERSAIKAECCDECGLYLKVLYSDRDLRVEPVADDIATTALDLLVSDAGYQRFGNNLMLLYGEEASQESVQ